MSQVANLVTQQKSIQQKSKEKKSELKAKIQVLVCCLLLKLFLDSLIVCCKESKQFSLLRGLCECLFFSMGIIRQSCIPDSWADGSFFSNCQLRETAIQMLTPKGQMNLSIPLPCPQRSSFKKLNIKFDPITEKKIYIYFK